MIWIAEHDVGLALQFADLRPHRIELRAADQWPHRLVVLPGITEFYLRQRRLQRRNHRGFHCARHQDATDRGALLPGLRGHLANYFANEEVEFRLLLWNVRPENRGVQRVALGDEAYRMFCDVWMSAQFFGCFDRAGERDHVLAAKMIEQVAGGAADQLQAGRRDQ